MKRVIISVSFCLFGLNATAQLEPGSIAFLRFNTDVNDSFSFLSLKEIAAGDTLFLTDEGWDKTAGILGWRNSSEEHLAYISTGLSPGDVVHIDEVSSDSFSVNGSGGSLLLSRGSGFSLSNGDQIIAYDGNNGIRPENPSFIAALHADDQNIDPLTQWTSNGMVSGVAPSTLPDNLINGVNAVSVFGSFAEEQDNMIYDCSITSGTASELLIAINDRSNWIVNNDSAYAAGSVCSFTVTTNPSIVISGDAGWRMLSFPITGGTVSDISDDSPVQGIQGGNDETADASFYINPSDDDSGTNGWIEPENISTSWGDGEGFIMYFFDNDVNGSSHLPVALEVSGIEPLSDVQISIPENNISRFTLFGNPFNSNIELDSLKSNDIGVGINNGLVSPVSIYSDSAESYITLNFDDSIGLSNTLAAWQGFFVEIVNPTAERIVTIPKSARSDSIADTFQFKNREANYREISFHLKNEHGDKDYSTKLFFSEKSTAGYDYFDGSKLASLSGSPLLSLVKNYGEGEEELLTQDARELNPEGLQLYYLSLNDAGISGEYTLSWPELFNIPNDWILTLRDLETGQVIDLRESKYYSFEVSAKQNKAVRSLLTKPKIKANKKNFSVPRFEIILEPQMSSSNQNGVGLESFALEQNYPNPFNPSTNIRYRIDQTSHVSLFVYNLLGQKVADLVNRNQSAGIYQVSWDADANASGIYIYRLVSSGQSITRKMTLIK